MYYRISLVYCSEQVRVVLVSSAGLGVAQVIVSAEVSIYYNMIIGWSLFYLFASFIHITDLPWASCYHEWNTERKESE